MVDLYGGSSDPKYGKPRRVKPVGFTRFWALKLRNRPHVQLGSHRCAQAAPARHSQARARKLCSPSGRDHAKNAPETTRRGSLVGSYASHDRACRIRPLRCRRIRRRHGAACSSRRIRQASRRGNARGRRHPRLQGLPCQICPLAHARDLWRHLSGPTAGRSRRRRLQVGNGHQTNSGGSADPALLCRPAGPGRSGGPRSATAGCCWSATSSASSPAATPSTGSSHPSGRSGCRGQSGSSSGRGLSECVVFNFGRGPGRSGQVPHFPRQPGGR